MPTTLPDRIVPEPPRPAGALALVAVALAITVLACSTLLAPPAPASDTGVDAGTAATQHGI